jgi:hypothetical protein
VAFSLQYLAYLRFLFNHAVARGPHGGLRTVGDAEFGDNVFDMGFDGAFEDE